MRGSGTARSLCPGSNKHSPTHREPPVAEAPLRWGQQVSRRLRLRLELPQSAGLERQGHCYGGREARKKPEIRTPNRLIAVPGTGPGRAVRLAARNATGGSSPMLASRLPVSGFGLRTSDSPPKSPPPSQPTSARPTLTAGAAPASAPPPPSPPSNGTGRIPGSVSLETAPRSAGTSRASQKCRTVSGTCRTATGDR
jgi:hypothetical protein